MLTLINRHALRLFLNACVSLCIIRTYQLLLFVHDIRLMIICQSIMTKHNKPVKRQIEHRIQIKSRRTRIHGADDGNDDGVSK